MGIWETARVIALVLNPFLGAPVSKLPPLPPPSSTLASPVDTAPDVMANADECMAPVWYSAEGIKHYVMSCLAQNPGVADPMVPDCTLPFEIESDGHRHYLTQCLDSVENECAVPYSFDGNVKKYKVDCL